MGSIMLDNFISKPNTVKISNIKSKFHSLMPGEHRTVFVKNTYQKPLSEHCSNENVGEQIEVSEYLAFKTGKYLGTISCMNNLLFDETKGENISPQIYGKSTRKLFKGNFVISRNASLGKISYINTEKQVILNGGISFLKFKPEFEFYAPAFFITKFGGDYLACITSGGGTQQNAKRGTLLSVPIPHPTLKNNKHPNEVIQLVSLIVQNLILKEESIVEKQYLINNLIIEELQANQKSKFKFYNSTINQITNNDLRFDAGMYSIEYKKNKWLIENYKNGYFNIPFEDLKSGSTPDVRLFSSKGIYKWVTPTDIKDEGFFTPTDNISMPSAFNLDKDAILFINRTSKGKKGEYVGIACFYDFTYYGHGHHNQGIYKVEAFSLVDKHFIVAFMNSTIMRKMCGFTSQGTKMKEMKMNNFSDLIFPQFPNEQKTKVAKAYYNNSSNTKQSTLDTYLDNEKSRNSVLGIFQLNSEIVELKKKLAILVDKIINEEKIDIEF